MYTVPLQPSPTKLSINQLPTDLSIFVSASIKSNNSILWKNYGTIGCDNGTYMALSVVEETYRANRMSLHHPGDISMYEQIKKYMYLRILYH